MRTSCADSGASYRELCACPAAEKRLHLNCTVQSLGTHAQEEGGNFTSIMLQYPLDPNTREYTRMYTRPVFRGLAGPYSGVSGQGNRIVSQIGLRHRETTAPVNSPQCSFNPILPTEYSELETPYTRGQVSPYLRVLSTNKSLWDE